MPGTVVSVARTTTEDLLEGLSELRAEDRVDDGVEGGVEVSEPEEEAGDVSIDAVIAEGTDESQEEEREPADDKRPGDDGECFSRLFLSLLLQRDVLLGLLLLGFPLLLLVEEEGALVGLTAGAGVFDWSVPGGGEAGERAEVSVD